MSRTGVWRERGRVYAEQCNWKKALECYIAALEVFPPIPQGATLLMADYEHLVKIVRELEYEVGKRSKR